MEHKFAIEAILKELSRLENEKKVFNTRIDALISQCDTSIEVLTGKKVWEVKEDMYYDDENPDYIKGSQEEI